MSDNVFADLPVNGIGSSHFVKFTTGDGLLAYVLTGAVLTTFRGDGLDFTRAPYAGLGSISNDNTAINAAWAVDSFELIGWDSVMRKAEVNCCLAVRDADGYILRVGYCVHLLGRLENMPALH
jgi:hypothetical protein